MNAAMIIIIPALILWLASFVVRRKNYQAGQRLSWIAMALAILAVIVKFCS